jgi:hypothetical protein
MLLQEGNAREHDNVAVHPGLTPAKGVAVISLVAPGHSPRTHIHPSVSCAFPHVVCNEVRFGGLGVFNPRVSLCDELMMHYVCICVVFLN